MQCQLIPFQNNQRSPGRRVGYVRNPEQGDMIPSHIAVAGYHCQISVQLKVSCYLFGLKGKVIVPTDEAVIRIIAKSLAHLRIQRQLL